LLTHTIKIYPELQHHFQNSIFCCPQTFACRLKIDTNDIDHPHNFSIIQNGAGFIAETSRAIERHRRSCRSSSLRRARRATKAQTRQPTVKMLYYFCRQLMHLGDMWVAISKTTTPTSFEYVCATSSNVSAVVSGCGRGIP
jgi:hypothetical protein